MGTLKIIITFAFLVWTNYCPAQDYDVIPWSSSKQLSWKDFKGEPTNERAAAITASGITYRFSTTDTNDNLEIDFKVITHFYPNKSWYNPSLVNAEILEHEQRHFDISEIFARKMRKRLSNTAFTHDIKREVKVIYQKINEEMNAFQNEYDSQTNFSRDLEAQEVWNKKIKELLNNN